MTVAAVSSLMLQARNLEVLVVGSACFEQETGRHLQSLAAGSGDSVEWTVVEDEAAYKALKSRKWDVVVVDRRCADARRFIRKAPRGARVFVCEDFAYGKDYLGEPCVVPEFKKYGCDQMAMYQDIVRNTRALCESSGASVLPVGTAVQNVRGSYDRDNLTRDGVHLNYNIGCFLAACTWYETLFGRDVTASVYNPGRMRPERVALARAAAHAAVQNPWDVTPDFGFKKLNKNYDEACVPSYTLPDPLTMQDGTRVENADQWYEKRRPELYHLFETEMYGRAPERPAALHFKQVSFDDGVFGGTAIRKEINIYFTEGDDHYMTLLLYIPKQVKGTVPVILGANFRGNASVVYDTGISLPDSAQIARYSVYREPVRGEMQGRWPVGMILARGYALATFYKGDIDPDFDDSFTNGVHPLFYREGQTYPDPDEWGSISAWAWGYSRALDYLETDPDVDASKVSTVGHSRLAKTALWAAVRDTRFAMAYPNNAGCGGAALSRRSFGETVETIVRHYHYWFCPNFAKYACNEASLPFDQHELIALMAPRPVYFTTGEYDDWSDPRGEYLSILEASKVYDFLGLKGLCPDGGSVDDLPSEGIPEPWKPVQGGLIGYHVRSGPHEITNWDWSAFLDFADRNLK